MWRTRSIITSTSRSVGVSSSFSFFFIILILYVDDILLGSNNVGLLLETKHSLFKVFDMNDLGEA